MIAMSDIYAAKILIVDDQEANVLLLRHILVGSGPAIHDFHSTRIHHSRLSAASLGSRSENLSKLR